MSSRLALVESLVERYPSVPAEAVVKEDLLRTGIAFDDSALSDNLDGAVKPKSYFIFSFDQKPLAELGEAATRRPPEEIALTGGPWGLRRTIVSVRVNPSSPWRVTAAGLELDGVFGLEGPGWILPDIEERMADSARRTALLEVARMLEREPSMLGASAHLLAVGRRRET